MRRATLIACLLAFTLHGFVHAQQASVNTPVLPGAPSNPLDPTPLLTSDFVRQRQVEPDLIVSTRNPQHLMAVFNDYRAVDIAADGFSNNQVLEHRLQGFRRPHVRVGDRPEGDDGTAAASCRSGRGVGRDGALERRRLTWTGAMVPGSPDDHSQASVSSPIYGLDAMTDPKGAAGPCGYAYVVLVAFTRGGESRIAVARWQDKNNKDGSEAWYYQGTSVVETGLNSTNGQFHDLPSIVVDPLRVTGGDPCAHNVYVGWARFNGNAGASVLNFARATAGSSANWNPTWALRFVGSMDKTNQAVTLAVDPRPGTPPKRRRHAVLRLARLQITEQPGPVLDGTIHQLRRHVREVGHRHRHLGGLSVRPAVALERRRRTATAGVPVQRAPNRRGRTERCREPDRQHRLHGLAGARQHVQLPGQRMRFAGSIR